MGTLGIQNPVLDNPVQDLYQFDTLSSGTAAGTALEQSFLGSGSPSFLRSDDQRAAASGYDSRVQAARNAAVGLPNARPTSPLLSPEQANKQAADMGLGSDLKFTKPVRQGEFDLVAKWKKEEIQRNDILSRADRGIIPGAARLGAGFLGAAVDPVNIALSFVPVVGEARYAYLAERLGPTAARVLKGAAEGAAGQAAVEPLIYLQAQNQQADYSAYDSLMNIVFGAVLGGGLHAGFGKISDWIGGHSIETRQAALNGAVAALAEDRPVTVADLFRYEETRRGQLTLGSTLGGLPRESGGVIPEFAGRQTPDSSPLSAQPENNAVIPAVKKNGAVQIFATEAEAQTAATRAGRDGEAFQVAPTDNGFILTRPAVLNRVGDFPNERQAQKALGNITNAAERDLAVVPDGQGRFTLIEGATPEQIKAMRDHPGATQLPEPKAPVSFFDTPSALSPDEYRAQLEQVVRETVQNTRRSIDIQPQDRAAMDAIAAKAVNYDRPITPETTAQEVADLVALADEGINHLKAEGRLSEGDLAEIQGANELINEARNRGAGIQAAAACFVRSA
jgi:hypothetical protein